MMPSRPGARARSPTTIALTVAAWGLLACDGGAEPGATIGAGGSGGAGGSSPVLGTSELPPQGQMAIEAWLAQGHYRTWRCEDGISSPRLNGAHGRQRICTNNAMASSAAGTYPAGASAVKEMFDRTDRPSGFAVSLKAAAGAGDETWYWYERTGTSPTSRPVADGIAAKACGPDCHAAAPRDNVFLRAP